ncbi:MAG: ribose-phosphate pyrophosphokinase-like domain-containing protein [Candidatus Poseidoniaceae archaeon]
MVVLSGSNAEIMAKQLAEELNWAHSSIETRRFPDTEGYIRIPDEVIESIRTEPVVLVSNTFPDSGIIETLLMLEAINDVRTGNLQNLREIGPQSLDDVGPGVLTGNSIFWIFQTR